MERFGAKEARARALLRFSVTAKLQLGHNIFSVTRSLRSLCWIVNPIRILSSSVFPRRNMLFLDFFKVTYPTTQLWSKNFHCQW